MHGLSQLEQKKREVAIRMSHVMYEEVDRLSNFQKFLSANELSRYLEYFKSENDYTLFITYFFSGDFEKIHNDLDRLAECKRLTEEVKIETRFTKNDLIELLEYLNLHINNEDTYEIAIGWSEENAVEFLNNYRYGYDDVSETIPVWNKYFLGKENNPALSKQSYRVKHKTI